MHRFGPQNSLLAVLVGLALTALAGCSEKIVSPLGQGTAVRIHMSIGGSGETAQASRFVLTVTGPGMIEPVVSELVYEGGFLTGRVVVPAGPNRLFRIDAYDDAGVVIYAGQAVADVKSGSEFELSIDLQAQVPMIKVSPTYVETMEGDLLAMTIRIYHLNSISQIEINLQTSTYAGISNLTPTTIAINPEIAKVAASETWMGQDYSTYIRLTLRDTQSNLVDGDGYAELATLYYQTHGPSLSATSGYRTDQYEDRYLEATTFFTPAVRYMADKSGQSLSVASIRAEKATVLLYGYDERLKGSWGMGYDYYCGACIPDDSPNGLDGTAHGTTDISGPVGFGRARRFNGTSDYIEVPDNSILDLRDEISISMWVYVGSYGLNPSASLICRRTENGPINYQLLLEDPSSVDGYMTFLFRYGGSLYHTYRVDIADSGRTTGWFHILFYYRFGDPSSATFVLGYGCYIEEMPGEWVVGDGRAPAPVAAGSLLLGKDNASTPSYFDGGLDEVELFDIVWTPALVHYYLFTGCR